MKKPRSKVQSPDDESPLVTLNYVISQQVYTPVYTPVYRPICVYTGILYTYILKGDHDTLYNLSRLHTDKFARPES